MRSKLAFVLFSLSAAWAQPAFDVASVKPSPPGGDTIDINLGTVSHGTVTLTNTTLSECIRFAYGLVSEDQISGPDWIRDRQLRVDITAKAPPDTADSDLRAMMQTLLKERFRLMVHLEPRRVAHFELHVGKNGSKVRPSAGDAPAFTRSYGRGHLAYSHVTVDRLAVLLSRQMRQPVIDRTGLQGFFDFQLDWLPDDAPATTADPATANQLGIFSAIQIQLGLKLEASKLSLDVVVVDRAEKVPLAN